MTFPSRPDLYREPRPSQCVPRPEPEILDVDPTHWAILWTAPGREVAVRAEIERLGYGAFLPIEVVTKEVPVRLRARFGHRREVQRPAIPRYVFAGLDPERQPWAPLSCDGVVGVVRCEPLPVQARLQRELSALRQAQDGGDYDLVRLEAERLRLWLEGVVGKRVRLVKGPFAGEDGLCEERVGKRLAIRVGPLRMTVDRDFVEEAC